VTAVRHLLTLAISLVLAACILGSSPQELSQSQTAPSPAGARKPVLVELFTSEGCSSCPPADTLLQKLLEKQPVASAEIIALEEHVDYWNHDGWFDPYSSADWTIRQQDYVALDKKDPYTPEMVVDGRSQFLGSDPREAIAEIEKAAGGVQTEVAITASDSGVKASPRFNISVGKLDASTAGDNAEVWLAVTEDGLRSSVNAGENSGRKLSHIATLRSLHKIGVADPNSGPASFTGTTEVKLNSHWNRENLHVTVFVQKKKSREIMGVASVKCSG
jgi:hypothetical protein